MQHAINHNKILKTGHDTSSDDAYNITTSMLQHPMLRLHQRRRLNWKRGTLENPHQRKILMVTDKGLLQFILAQLNIVRMIASFYQFPMNVVRDSVGKITSETSICHYNHLNFYQIVWPKLPAKLGNTVKILPKDLKILTGY